MRKAHLALIASALAACAGTPDATPINRPYLAAPAAVELELSAEEDVIALALSGGGARAASFSYGALLALRDLKDAADAPLIEKVALVTAVSGGAITAAWLGRHGMDGLDGFRAAALDKDWQDQLHTSFASPNNWVRFLQGGLNGRDKLADWLDREVFDGARIADLRPRPLVVINAADLYTGAPFAFARPWLEAVCSDLQSLRLADAVAASMAAPFVFRPVIVRIYSEDCPSPPGWVEQAASDRQAPVLLRETARAFQLYRTPKRMTYLHLVDGGVADNFGLSSLITLRKASRTPYGPFSARDAVRMRSLAFLVINAEMTPAGDWARTAEGPTGGEMIAAAVNVAVNAPKRAAADAFAAELDRWEDDIIAWRCRLPKEEAARLGAGPGWRCDDLRFSMDIISFADLAPEQYDILGAAPTQVSLPRELIDQLIDGGRKAVEDNPAIRALLAR